MIYDGLKSTDRISLARELEKWTREINSCYDANFQGSNVSYQDSRLPENLPKICLTENYSLKSKGTGWYICPK